MTTAIVSTSSLTPTRLLVCIFSVVALMTLPGISSCNTASTTLAHGIIRLSTGIGF
jgi:hypothetical protein